MVFEAVECELFSRGYEVETSSKIVKSEDDTLKMTMTKMYRVTFSNFWDVEAETEEDAIDYVIEVLVTPNFWQDVKMNDNVKDVFKIEKKE